MNKNVRSSIIYISVFLILLGIFMGLRLYNLGYFAICLGAQATSTQIACNYILASSIQTAAFFSIPLSGSLLIFIFLSSRRKTI